MSAVAFKPPDEPEGGVAGWSPGAPEHHVHEWVDASVGCEDCGDHNAVRCVNEPCPDDYDDVYIDLVFNDDPRDNDDA